MCELSLAVTFRVLGVRKCFEYPDIRTARVLFKSGVFFYARALHGTHSRSSRYSKKSHKNHIKISPKSHKNTNDKSHLGRYSLGSTRVPWGRRVSENSSDLNRTRGVHIHRYQKILTISRTRKVTAIRR